MPRNDCLIVSLLKKFHLFKQTQKKKKHCNLQWEKIYIFTSKAICEKKKKINIAKISNIYQIKDFS